MFNLQALEAAFAQVEQVGKGELSFDINGTSLTLRVLLPEEEIEVQRFAASILDKDNENDQHTALEYLDRFKLGVLSHAICQVGSTDFRDVQFVETGEVLGNGKPAKITKVAAVRQLLGRWSRPVLQGVFKKYAELLADVERKAEAAIEYEPADLGTEIDRLEQRLAELKERQEQERKKLADPFSQQVQRVAGEVAPEPTPDPEPEVEAYEPAPQQPAPQQPAPRRTAIPQSAPPPVQALPVDVPVPPVPQAQAAPQRPPRAYADSFIDSSDAEGMAEAIQAENARLLAARGAAMAPTGPAESVLTAAHQAGIRRRPPHLDALSVDRALRATEPAEGGEDAFDRGVEELGVRQAPPGPTRVNLDPQTKGAINPRFRPGR